MASTHIISLDPSLSLGHPLPIVLKNLLEALQHRAQKRRLQVLGRSTERMWHMDLGRHIIAPV